MAVGDLNGDLRDAYLTPEQRAAKMAGKSGGPVSRVAGQVSLADAAPKQTSFDATNLPAQYAKPATSSLASLAPSGAASTAQPAATAPTKSVSLSSLSPPSASATAQSALSQTPASLRDAYPVGMGDGKKAIFAGVGMSGEPSFSDSPSSLSSIGQNFTAPDVRQSQRMTSLSDGWSVAQQTPAQPSQATQSVGRRPSLADGLRFSEAPQSPSAQPASGFANLGTVRNMGDGVGVFSQANAGDAAISMTNFQRAHDLRDAYRNQDRLDNAIARQAQDSHFTVVRDSSRKPSLADLRFDQLRQQHTENLQNGVLGAQRQLEAGRAGRAADRQDRQAQRLEDAFQLASSPNATPDQQAAYARLNDPTGEKAVARQLAQANITKLGADARKSDAEAANLSSGVDAQLKQQQLTKAQRENQTADQDATAQKRGALDNARDALKLVSEISGADNLDNITGTLSSKTPTVRDSSQDLINKAARLQTLLTADNLKLMTGVLTDRDITFLSQIGAGLGIGERGINGSLDATKQRLGEISTRLGEKISTYEKNLPAGERSTAQASPASGQPVRVATPADVAKLPSGATFIAPDGSMRRKP